MNWFAGIAVVAYGDPSSEGVPADVSPFSVQHRDTRKLHRLLLHPSTLTPSTPTSTSPGINSVSCYVTQVWHWLPYVTVRPPGYGLSPTRLPPLQTQLQVTSLLRLAVSRGFPWPPILGFNNLLEWLATQEISSPTITGLFEGYNSGDPGTAEWRDA